jgi:outer membrane lipoprotein-sorting protein
MTRFRKATLGLGGMVVLLGVLALAACGGSSAAAKPTATPDAQSILQKVQAGSYKDGTFTITLSGTSSGTSFTGTGSGKFTTSPGRASMTLTATVSGQQVEIDIITDDTTSTTYTRIPLLSDKWTKASTSSSGFGAGSVGTFNLQNATLLGTEQLNGVTVYHLQGQDTTDAGTKDDFYVRTDTYQPVRVVAKSSDSSATIDFTSFNTGITIDLPPASQVQA